METTKAAIELYEFLGESLIETRHRARELDTAEAVRFTDDPEADFAEMKLPGNGVEEMEIAEEAPGRWNVVGVWNRCWFQGVWVRVDRDGVMDSVDLRALLSRYGRHDKACPLSGEANLPGDWRCTCGFSKALLV